MRDTLLKLAVLVMDMRRDPSLAAFRFWRREIWRCDMDDLWCCPGHECGCYGITAREFIEGLLGIPGASHWPYEHQPGIITWRDLR